MCITFSSFFAQAQNLSCTPSGTSGFIEVPLIPHFTLEQFISNPRLREIYQQLPYQWHHLYQQTPFGLEGKNSSLQIYFELGKPFDPNQESIFMAGGFYPWLNLPWATNTFSFLSQNYNVFQIHFRGSGCSVTEPGLHPLLYTHEMIAADLDQVRQALGANKISSWASSNGSMVMLSYSLLYPNSIDKVLLRDTAIYYPQLQESSYVFENKTLPEFLGANYLTKVDQVKEIAPSLYRDLLKLFGTVLFRNDKKRNNIFTLTDYAYNAIISGAPDIETLKGEIKGLLQSSINNIPAWPEAVTANECVDFTVDASASTNGEDLYIANYSYERCMSFKTQYPYFQISSLDFRGQLSNLSNSFFIYQGYWDDIFYNQLAHQLHSELPNSFLHIDTTVGHGEINQQSIRCFGNILYGFFSGQLPEVYMDSYQQ